MIIANPSIKSKKKDHVSLPVSLQTLQKIIKKTNYQNDRDSEYTSTESCFGSVRFFNCVFEFTVWPF